MSEEEKTYEMFWDCEYCDSKKLLGKSHRHCPVCGAAQNPDKRYFPPEDQKVAVEDHVYHGADICCPACQAPNSAAAKFCCECGSPLEEGGQVNLVTEETDGVKPASSGKVVVGTVKKRSKKIPIIVASAVAAVIAVVLVMVFWTKTVSILVTEHSWNREIKIESYETRNKSTWCTSMPTSAYQISRSREIRSHKKIADGETCTTKNVDKGDGTFKKKKVCKTKYREEPVYDDKCRYKLDSWEYKRSEVAKGKGLDSKIIWPTVTLKKQGISLGSQRQGERVETYTVHYKDEDGETFNCNFGANKWKSIKNGSKWSGEAAVMTGSLDCDSLKPAR